MYLNGEKCPVSADELKRAADEMKSFAWQRLENGFGAQDEALRAMLEDAAAEFREAPDTLWTFAAHAWNTGHLPAAAEYVEKLLAHDPEDAKVRLLKIEILIRQNNSTDLFAELVKPIKELHWPSENAFRVASLLGHFGYLERAASLAYRLYLEHRDQEQAWMTFCGIMLGNGRNASHLWTSPVVAPNVAVDLKFDDGEKVFFVVEPSADLRKLDAASWEPEHALVNAVARLAPGARFVGPGGREGEVVQLRYKYVARFHYLMEHYEKRFPTLRGLRRLPIAVGEPDGLAALIETLKARHDWIQQEQEQYLKGPWPLGLLAFRVGVDTIDAAFGLAAQGLSFKVAVGTEDEREAAFETVRQNGAKGVFSIWPLYGRHGNCKAWMRSHQFVVLFTFLEA
jgi:hypothetical protein